MNWKDLLYYALVEQAFKDEETKDFRLGATMPSLLKEEFMKDIYRFPKQVNTDPVELFAEDGEEDDLRLLYDQIAKPGETNGFCQSAEKNRIIVDQDGEKLPFVITKRTQFESSLSDGDAVHVFSDWVSQKQVAIVVASERLHKITSMFCEGWSQLRVEEEFICMDEPLQAAILRMLCNESAANSNAT